MVRGICLGCEEQGVHRGVPWAAMEAAVGPRLFAAVAWCGLLLDGSMAAALLCLRPTRESFAAFAALSCAFHGFTCFTVWIPNLQPDFNVSVFDGFDARLSAVLRELHESNRFVQKSAESTSIRPR